MCFFSRTVPIHLGTITITLISGTVYILSSPNASDVIELMTMFMKGLKARSRFVMAVNDVTPDGT